MFVPPLYLLDREEPYRPSLVAWLELPEGTVVGQDVVMPEDVDGAVAHVLREALTQPATGVPRRPDTIRVADAAIAAEVRAAVRGTIPVTVAPTPELDDLRDQLLESMPPGDEDDSYFAGGRVSPAAVERLFTAARALFAMKPWSLVSDIRLLRLDIPALNVDGACLVVRSQTSGRRGMFIFPTPDAFDAFMDMAMQQGDDIDSGPTDITAGHLALVYERVTDLPRSKRREAMTHGWRVDSPDAYPMVECRDADGALRPVVERDVEIVAACAMSLGAFVLKHASIFSSDTSTAVCESYFDDDDLEVRFTFPCDALSDVDARAPVDDADGDMEFDVAFDAEPPPPEPFRPRATRNAPCPCGSGRKYKKCCLPADEAKHADRRQSPVIQESDERLVNRLTHFAISELGNAWESFGDDFHSVRRAVSLAAPWSVYGFEVDGRSVVEAYLDRHGRRCTPEERSWLNAQRAAWLSVWEVLAVDPGTTVTLRDLLSDERRTVLEERGSLILASGDALLGRVVDHDGTSFLCGMHPHILAPGGAAEIVRLARERLQCKKAVPSDRLRNAAFGSYLIRCWEEAVDPGDV